MGIVQTINEINKQMVDARHYTGDDSKFVKKYIGYGNKAFCKTVFPIINKYQHIGLSKEEEQEYSSIANEKIFSILELSSDYMIFLDNVLDNSMITRLIKLGVTAETMGNESITIRGRKGHEMNVLDVLYNFGYETESIKEYLIQLNGKEMYESNNIIIDINVDIESDTATIYPSGNAIIDSTMSKLSQYGAMDLNKLDEAYKSARIVGSKLGIKVLISKEWAVLTNKAVIVEQETSDILKTKIIYRCNKVCDSIIKKIIKENDGLCYFDNGSSKYFRTVIIYRHLLKDLQDIVNKFNTDMKEKEKNVRVICKLNEYKINKYPVEMETIRVSNISFSIKLLCERRLVNNILTCMPFEYKVEHTDSDGFAVVRIESDDSNRALTKIKNNKLLNKYFKVKVSCSKNVKIDAAENKKVERKKILKKPVVVEAYYSRRKDAVTLKTKEKRLRTKLIKELGTFVKEERGIEVLIEKHAVETAYSIIVIYAEGRKVETNIKSLDYGIVGMAELRDRNIYINKQFNDLFRFKNIAYQPSIVGYIVPLEDIDILMNNAREKRRLLMREHDEDYKNYTKLILSLKKMKETYSSDEVEFIDVREVVKVSNLPEPKDFQYDGANMIIQGKKMILADPMGLGKTKTTALATTYMAQLKKIVIVPSTIKNKWKYEISLVNNNVTILVDDDNNGFKKIALEDIENNEYIITNYERANGLITAVREYKEKYGEDSIYIVCDEAHRLGGVNDNGTPTAQWTKSVFELSRGVEYITLVTGTPMRDNVKTLYNLLKLVDAKVAYHPKYFFERYCKNAIDSNKRGRYNGGVNIEELMKSIENKIIKRDHLKKSIIKRAVQNITIDEAEYKIYNEMIKSYGRVHDMREPFVRYEAHKQAVSIIKMRHSLDFAVECIESGSKVVIFSHYIEPLKSGKMLMARKGYNAEILIGENKKDREDIINRLNNGEIDILLCSIKTGGEGLDFTGAKVGIINDVNWTFLELTQAEARLDRMTSTDECIVRYTFAENLPIENRLMGIVEEKLRNLERAFEPNSTNTLRNAIIQMMNDNII